MSEAHEQVTGNGAAVTTAAKRKRIATANVGTDGRVSIDFASGEKVEFDAAKVPGAQGVTGPALALLAYGAAAAVQTAYSNADAPVEAAREALGRIMAGKWAPGLPRHEREIDPLLLALAEHLHKTPDYVEEHFFRNYCEKHGYLDSDGKPVIGTAKRQLRQHPEIAARIAKILADRAAKAAKAAKGGAVEL